MTSRKGRCIKCEHCSIKIEKKHFNGTCRISERAIARCTFYPHDKVDGKLLDYACVKDDNYDAAIDKVKERRSKNVSPIWCPLDI